MMAMPGIQNALAGTKPWVRLVSILGFISAGFMIVAGLFAAVLGGFSDAMPAGATAIFLIYPLTRDVRTCGRADVRRA